MMLDPSIVFATIIVVALGLGLWIAIAMTYACVKLSQIEVATTSSALGISPKLLCEARLDMLQEKRKKPQ